MAERKTGVIPLDLITEKDKERYSADELVEYILKILKFLKDGEEPTFSGRGLQEKFEGKEAFFRTNMEKFEKRVQNLKYQRFVIDSITSRHRVDNESAPNRIVSNEICDMRNENKRKINKKKSLSNIIEHDYSEIEIKDARRTLK